MTGPERFFFYGTLISGSANSAARAAHRRLEPLGPATTSGKLWAIPDPLGWYPALVAGEGVVHGAAYAAGPDFGPDDLAAIDAWEGIDPARPAAAPYRRERAAIRLGEAWAEAGLYRFVAPLPAGAVLLPGGDFRAWLRLTNNSAYVETE